MCAKAIKGLVILFSNSNEFVHHWHCQFLECCFFFLTFHPSRVILKPPPSPNRRCHSYFLSSFTVHSTWVVNKNSINVITLFSEKLALCLFSPEIYFGFRIFSLTINLFSLISETLIHSCCSMNFQYILRAKYTLNCRYIQPQYILPAKKCIYFRLSIFCLLPPAGVMHNWAWARHDPSSRLEILTSQSAA